MASSPSWRSSSSVRAERGAEMIADVVSAISPADGWVLVSKVTLVLAVAWPVARTLRRERLAAASAAALAGLVLLVVLAPAAATAESSASAGTLQPRECFAGQDERGATGTRVRGDGIAVVSERVTAQDGRDERIVLTRLDDVALCMRYASAVVFDAAGTRIESFGEDGWLVLEARGERGAQRLEIVPGPAGPQHAWYVDGVARPFDDAAREWRDAMIGVLTTHYDIAMLRGREAGLRGRIAGVRGREAGMGGEIASIRGREAGMRGEIASLRGRDAARRAEAASVRARVASLDNARRVTSDAETRARLDAEIAALRASMRDAGQAQPEPAVELRIREIEQRIAAYDTDGRIAEVERRLATLDVTTEIAAMEREIAELDAEGRIRPLEARLEPRRQRLRAALRGVR
jgi:hypothetical protein